MLGGIIARRVDGDELRRVIEHRPRSRGEVLQPGADGDDDIRCTRHLVGGRRPDDADGSDMRRMVMRHGALSGNRLRHRDAVLQREVGNLLLGSRIAHTAAGDDERLLWRS